MDCEKLTFFDLQKRMVFRYSSKETTTVRSVGLSTAVVRQMTDHREASA